MDNKNILTKPISKNEIIKDESWSAISKEKMKDMLETLEAASQKALSGDISPLHLTCISDELIKSLAKVKNKIKDVTIQEASFYPKCFKTKGYEITQKSGSKKTNYSHIPEIIKLEKELNELKEFYKNGLISIENGTAISSVVKIDGSDLICFTDNNGELHPAARRSFGSDSLIIKKDLL